MWPHITYNEGFTHTLRQVETWVDNAMVGGQINELLMELGVRLDSFAEIANWR